MEETLLISKENAPIGQKANTFKKIDVCKYTKKKYKDFFFSCSEEYMASYSGKALLAKALVQTVLGFIKINESSVLDLD